MADLFDLAAGLTVRYGENGDASRSLLAERVKFRKGHVPAYMISRAFIPPWSLVMRDRKLLDQTPPVKEAGTLVSLSRLLSRSCCGKVKKIFTRPSTMVPSWCWALV